jgi:hypothetical protein
VGIDDTWTGPAKEGCPSDIYIRWRIEGLNGLAIGDIGWCKDPYTTPSTIRYASKCQKDFETPVWSESWFPDAFIGTMAQLLIALEDGTEPAISGKDNLKTMALVDAAYLSSVQFRSVALNEIKPGIAFTKESAREKPRFWSRFFSAPNPITQRTVVGSAVDASDMGNFTPRATQILELARGEAARFNHTFVGTEHLLLGLIALGQGVAVNVLRNHGLNLDTVRLEVEKQIGTGPDQKIIGKIPFTPRVMRVLGFAAKEASVLHHTYVGTEHILLGLLREGEGVAAHILKDLKLDIKKTRKDVLKELDPNFKP